MLLCCLVVWVLIWLLRLFAFRFAWAFDCFGWWLVVYKLVPVVAGLVMVFG